LEPIRGVISPLEEVQAGPIVAGLTAAVRADEQKIDGLGGGSGLDEMSSESSRMGEEVRRMKAANDVAAVVVV
jgi:hypothetical protein